MTLKKQRVLRNRLLILAGIVILFVLASVTTAVVTSRFAQAEGDRGILCTLTGCEFTESAFSAVLANLLPEKVIEDVSLGASPGPERFNEFESINGNLHFYYGGRFTQGTTTVFSAPIPTATSTVSVACSILTASSTATIWTLAETLNFQDNHATTTELASIVIAADQPGFLLYNATTTVMSTGETSRNHLILSVSGGVSGADETAGTGGSGFVPVGSCSYDFNIY